jgi:hypothetical protein
VLVGEHVSIAFQRALAFVMEKKIVLVGNVGSKLPIINKSHNLHANDIRGVWVK